MRLWSLNKHLLKTALYKEKFQQLNACKSRIYILIINKNTLRISLRAFKKN
jgi:hypothetical protein